MINEISVKGYKCLLNSTFEISNLNIFAGPNSSGKSSTLQTLLLLRQSGTEQKEIHNLNLSGELYEGGTTSDVLHPDAEYKIEYNIGDTAGSFRYEFEWDRQALDGQNARSLEAIAESDRKLAPELASSDFLYLNAERARPRAFYDLPSDRVGLAGLLGKSGEFTVAQLARASQGLFHQDWSWSDELRPRIAAAPRLLDEKDFSEAILQTEGRIDSVVNIMLDWILPGAHFEASEQATTDTAVLSFVRDLKFSKSRPTHMGFGLTYALPVISSGFFMKAGGIIIVENPEAHLHPYSQSRLGVLLAIFAAAGRQVFIETHSDHLVNGIRVAVSRDLINHELVRTHFFSPPTEGTTANITKILCDKRGRMSDWPQGFFDQIESDLSKI